MARKRKKKALVSSRVIAISIVGFTLVSVQVAYLYYQSATSGSSSFPDAIDKGVADIEDPVLRAQTKIKFAVRAYKIKHKELPESLRMLVPEFLPKIPKNPHTKKPFYYTKQGNHFGVYSSKEASEGYVVASAAGAAGKKDSINKNLELPDIAAIKSDFVYDPSGRRDPFTPFNYDAANITDCDTPLQCIPLSRLQLVTVLSSSSGNKAMVEAMDGRGFSIEVGTKIGTSGGEVVDIQNGKVLILETQVTFTGEKEQKTVELSMKSASSDKGKSRRR